MALVVPPAWGGSQGGRAKGGLAALDAHISESRYGAPGVKIARADARKILGWGLAGHRMVWW